MALSRKKKIIIAVSAVALLGLVVVISIFARGKDEAEVTVVKVDVRPELKSTVTASGEVRPIRFVNLTSEVQGRITEISVNPGDHVTTGQPLVRVDPTQLESSAEAQAASVQAAISDVQNARTAISSAENARSQQQQSLLAAEASLSRRRARPSTPRRRALTASRSPSKPRARELKRTTELIEAGVASRLEFDTAQDRLKTAQVALKTSQAQLESAKIAVEESKARVNQQRVAVADAQNGVKRARESVQTSEARANSQQALLRGQSSQRSKAVTGLAADGRRRGHPGARRAVRRRGTLDHLADDHCRHDHDQRRGQRGRDRDRADFRGAADEGQGGRHGRARDHGQGRPEEPARRLTLRHYGRGPRQPHQRPGGEGVQGHRPARPERYARRRAQLAPARHDRDGHHHDERQAERHRHPPQAIVEKIRRPRRRPRPAGRARPRPRPPRPRSRRTSRASSSSTARRSSSSPSRPASRASRTSRS